MVHPPPGHPQHPSVVRALGVLGVVYAAALVGAYLAVSTLLDAEWPPGRGVVGFADALTLVCASAGLVAGGWLVTGVTLVVADALRGRPDGRGRGLPPRLRRLLLAGCGAALTAGLAVPAAGAAPAHTHNHPAGHPADHPADPVALTDRIRGLPLPDRAVGGPPADPAPAPPSTRVVVRPGDSLWSLARDRLGRRAAPGEVATAWRRLYEANRSRVGPDPDLIIPGTALEVPRGLGSRSATHEHPASEHREETT